METLKEKVTLLDQWIVVHKSMLYTNQDIPSAEAIHLSKLRDGIITTDTCNSARLLSSLIKDAVTQAVGQKIEDCGENPDNEQINVYTQDCHNHMRNVWIGAVTKRLSSYLNEILASNLEAIDFRY